MKKWSTRFFLGLLVLGLMLAVWMAGSYFRSGAGPSIAVDPKGRTIQIAGDGLPFGCRCHSNKPAVIAAHKRYGVSDCDKCHPKTEPQEKPKN